MRVARRSLVDAALQSRCNLELCNAAVGRPRHYALPIELHSPMPHLLYYRTVAHLLAMVFVSLTASAVEVQGPSAHFQHAGKLPPGAIGGQQLLRGGPLPGYFQPVEIKAPAGAMVSLAIDGQFSALQATPLRVGMLIAPVYRFRVAQIPDRPARKSIPRSRSSTAFIRRSARNFAFQFPSS